MDPIYEDIRGGLTTGGSANAYTLTTNQSFTGYYQGMWIKAKIHASNTTASTLNVNGIGAAAITTASGDALGASQLLSGCVYDFVHNGSNFVALNAAEVNVITAATTAAISAAIGALTASSLPGTTTNDDAAAGFLGEVIRSDIASGSAVSLTSGVSANITTIPLTAGDWDVHGWVETNPAGGTTTSVFIAAISTTSATLSPYPTILSGIAAPAGNGVAAPIATRRISLAGATTVYLVARVTFATSTLGAYGFVEARRAR